MRERYIEQVEKALMLSKERKAEVVRDLQEAFASAREHGETDRQVMERLGSPEDFAAGIHEQLGKNSRDGKKGQKPYRIPLITALLVTALAAFAVSAVIYRGRTPSQWIGQADATTSMRVSGAGIDPAALLLGFGLIAVLVTIIFIVRSARKK